MSSKVILLLAVILLALSLCQAKMTQSKAGDPQFETYITLSFAGKTGVGATTGKIPGPAKFLAKCHVFGIFLVNLKTIFSKPTFCQITHCNYKLLHY